MKTFGMLGGMGWESTVSYYSVINREVQKRTGGRHAARTLLYSFDFGEITPLQVAGKWDEIGDRLATAGAGLARGGADFLIICCNTQHVVSDALERAARIPLIHIADPLGEAMKRAGMSRAALLGTRYTMERDDVLKGRLKSRFGIECLVPSGADAAELNRIIFEELTQGNFNERARAHCRGLIKDLAAEGAEGVILGCTELPLLLNAEDSSVPMFDTATLHALAAVDLALE